MKYLHLALFLAFLAPFSQSNAQGLSLQLRGSYNLPYSSSTLESVSVTDSNGIVMQEANIVSLGAGLSFGLDASYKFDSHVGVQMGFQYLMGNRTRALVSEQAGFININSEVFTRQGQVTIGGIVCSGGDPVDIYARVGLLIPVFGKTTIDILFDAPFIATREFTRTEVTGRFSLGFYGGFGARYALSEQIGLSLEATFSSLKIRANQAVVVEKRDEFTGESILEDQATSNVITNYQFELGPDSNNPETNPDFVNTEPLDELTYTSNYSNLALQLGFSYSFGKK